MGLWLPSADYNPSASFPAYIDCKYEHPLWCAATNIQNTLTVRSEGTLVIESEWAQKARSCDGFI